MPKNCFNKSSNKVVNRIENIIPNIAPGNPPIAVPMAIPIYELPYEMKGLIKEYTIVLISEPLTIFSTSSIPALMPVRTPVKL